MYLEIRSIRLTSDIDLEYRIYTLSEWEKRKGKVLYSIFALTLIKRKESINLKMVI